jgi:hypothetical protein
VGPTACEADNIWRLVITATLDAFILYLLKIYNEKRRVSIPETYCVQQQWPTHICAAVARQVP